MTSTTPPIYAILPPERGVIAMGAKAVVHQGKWRVQVNLENKSRLITRLRDYVRNPEYSDQQVAEIVSEIINTQVMVGNFQWDYWFPQDKRQFKFKTLALDWLSAATRKPATDYQYHRVMRQHIIPVMGDKDVRALRRPDFHWIRKAHGDTAKAKNIRSVCQTFLVWCYREEIREAAITLPEIYIKRKPLPYLSLQDRERIQAEVSPEYQPATLLSLRMGLRAGEIAALEWSAVEWGSGINISSNLSYYQKASPKEGGSRFSPFQGEVEATLTNLYNNLKAQGILPAGYVFRLDTGARVWPNWISWRWSQASERVGIKAKLHWNRHSLAQDMLAEGFSITEVQAILGHRSAKTTEQSYARHNRASMVRIADARMTHYKPGK